MHLSYSSYRLSAIHPIRHIVLVQFILFFKSSWCKIASLARNLINSAPSPQAAARTFAFSSVFILLLWYVLKSSNILPLEDLLTVYCSWRGLQGAGVWAGECERSGGLPPRDAGGGGVAHPPPPGHRDLGRPWARQQGHTGQALLKIRVYLHWGEDQDSCTVHLHWCKPLILYSRLCTHLHRGNVLKFDIHIVLFCRDIKFGKQNLTPDSQTPALILLKFTRNSHIRTAVQSFRNNTHLGLAMLHICIHLQRIFFQEIFLNESFFSCRNILVFLLCERSKSEELIRKLQKKKLKLCFFQTIKIFRYPAVHTSC